MPDELAEIFILFILGLIFTFVSWRAWTQKEVTYRSQRYRRKDSPFAFWFYLSLFSSIAILSLIFAIVFSIHLLRSSWRTVNTGEKGSSRSLTSSNTLPDVRIKRISLRRWSPPSLRSRPRRCGRHRTTTPRKHPRLNRRHPHRRTPRGRIARCVPHRLLLQRRPCCRMRHLHVVVKVLIRTVRRCHTVIVPHPTRA